jgi:hypothetical protein
MGYPGDNNQPSWHGANASDNGGSGAPASSDPAAPVQGSPWPQEQPSSWDVEPSWMQQPAQGGAWPPAEQQPAQGGWPEQQPSHGGSWPPAEQQPSQGGWPEQQPSQGGAAWPPAEPQPSQGGWPEQQPEVPQNPWLNAPPQAPSGTQPGYDPRSGPQQRFESNGAQTAYEPPPYEQPWNQQPNHEQWPNETLSAGPDRAALGRGRVPVGRKKSNRTPVLIGTGVIGAMLLAGGGYYLMNKSDDKKVTTPPAAGASQTASAAPKASATTVKPPATPVTGKAKSRATDPKPLTFKEVFTKKKFTAGGVSYVLTARSSTTCAKAVHGVKLLGAMKSGKCTQFLRGTFATANGKLIGTIGVANLSTSSAATIASTAGKAKDAYLIALPAKGLTAKIGQGQALGEAQARGHYLIMSWVQLPNGKKIPTGSAAYKVAQAFVQNVIVGSNVSPALHARDETGKPWQPR